MGTKVKLDFLKICSQWLLKVGHFSFANNFSLLISFMYMCVWYV